jgi:hypothetical protein
MPLKLHIAASQKVGQANYGSRGASLGLELEVDSSLAQQPRQLHAEIDRLFRFARQCLAHELGARRAADAEDGSSAGQAVRPATAAQVRAIHALASRHQRDLVAELRSAFHVHRPEELSLEEASRLISQLQAGNGAAASNGAASG